MKVRIEFTETSKREVTVEVASLDEAERIFWRTETDEDYSVLERWVEESEEYDGGTDFDSAVFTEVEERNP